VSKLEDRTVVIIGGGSGIGLEVARPGSTYTTGSTLHPDGGHAVG
jgi:hypothetical protein